MRIMMLVDSSTSQWKKGVFKTCVKTCRLIKKAVSEIRNYLEDIGINVGATNASLTVFCGLQTIYIGVLRLDDENSIDKVMEECSEAALNNRGLCGTTAVCNPLNYKINSELSLVENEHIIITVISDFMSNTESKKECENLALSIYNRLYMRSNKLTLILLVVEPERGRGGTLLLYTLESLAKLLNIDTELDVVMQEPLMSIGDTEQFINRARRLADKIVKASDSKIKIVVKRVGDEPCLDL